MSTNKFEQLQLLYKVSPSTGKMQTWSGWTLGSLVFCEWGVLGGKMQSKEYHATPKNVGRGNETCADLQALIELEAMYQSQCDNKHYKTSEIEAIKASEVCRIPRKVTNYKDRYNKMSDILLTSVKKDGSRACVIEGNLYSKIGRHEEIKVTHLRDAVEQLHQQGVAVFDAEVFAEGLSLQRIRSAWLKPVKTSKEIIKIAKDRAKKKGEDNAFLKWNEVSAVGYLGYNPNEDAPKLKFFVFDIPDNTGKIMHERVNDMIDFEKNVKHLNLSESFEMLYPVYTKSHEHRMEILERVCSNGEEGLVHYEPEGVYEFGKRSTNTAKSKPRLDAECKVVSVTKDKNGEGLLNVIGSDVLDSCGFKLKMKVERRDGNRYPRDYESMLGLVGKWITFSYEALSDSGKPQKPVGEEERLCDSYGRPLE